MSGIILAFDTSTEAIGLGVACFDGADMTVLASRSVTARRQANSLLLELVVEALEGAGAAIGDVECVVVGRGPGSFTGVRIGVAAAKGLAQGLDAPLFGVSTSEAVAWRLALGGYEGTIGVLGDAMRGEVYPAIVEAAAGAINVISPDRVAKPADVAAEWAQDTSGEVRLTGNGLLKYRDVFESALGERATFAPEELWHPDGEGLLRAWLRSAGSAGRGSGDPGGVLPVYTRLSDAEENERARRGLGSTSLPQSGVAGRAPAEPGTGGGAG